MALNSFGSRLFLVAQCYPELTQEDVERYERQLVSPPAPPPPLVGFRVLSGACFTRGLRAEDTGLGARAACVASPRYGHAPYRGSDGPCEIQVGPPYGVTSIYFNTKRGNDALKLKDEDGIHYFSGDRVELADRYVGPWAGNRHLLYWDSSRRFGGGHGWLICLQQAIEGLPALPSLPPPMPPPKPDDSNMTLLFMLLIFGVGVRIGIPLLFKCCGCIAKFCGKKVDYDRHGRIKNHWKGGVQLVRDFVQLQPGTPGGGGALIPGSSVPTIGGTPGAPPGRPVIVPIVRDALVIDAVPI